jgi:hypothetical protein
VSRITFGQARRNFYQAARFGLASELIWPQGSHARLVPAQGLIPALVPVAREGLCGAGVVPDEADAWLSVVAQRVERRMTGSRWQRACFDRASKGSDARSAARAMLERYMFLSEEGRPVAEWPCDGP